ncbi:MAG: restriction endonuclease subunit S [Lacticaseibacillus paracasei]
MFLEFAWNAWEKRKLGDYFPEILSGNRLPKSQIKSGPIPYVIATTRSNGIGGYVSKGQTDFSGNQMKLFKENSITVSIDNPEAIFLQQIPFVASNVMRILHNSDLTKNQLIVFLQILRSVTKGFNWSIKFSGPVIKNIEFTSPINLKELESIGAFLSSLDSLIAATQHKIDALEQAKKALLQRLFDQSWRFKGYSDPWEKRKLGDYFPEILSGNRLPKSQIKSGPIPYVIATTRSNGIGGYVSKGQTDFSGNQMKLFKENSITVSIDNPEAIFLQQIPFVASNVMRILHNSDLTKNQLIVFLQILRSVTKGFNWSIKFSGPVIKNIEFTSPINLKELESIGAFLSSLDSLIAATQHKIDALEQAKKALLQRLFDQSWRFKGYSDPWEKRKLLEISKTYSGLTYHPEDIRESGTFVIRSSNVQNGSIVTADDVYVSPDIVNSSNVLKGDVIVVVRNGSRNLIGKHALMIRDMPNTVIGAFMTGIRSAHGPFINALLSTKDFQSEVRKSLGATINQITIRDFKLMSFAVPNSQEVNSIGAIFGMLDNLIAATQSRLSSLELLKKALLQDLFI